MNNESCLTCLKRYFEALPPWLRARSQDNFDLFAATREHAIADIFCRFEGLKKDAIAQIKMDFSIVRQIKSVKFDPDFSSDLCLGRR